MEEQLQVQKDQAERERICTDLDHLAKKYLGYQHIAELCHGPLRDKLQDVQAWMDFLCLMPRGHLKTSYLAVAWVIQQLLINKHIRIAILSATPEKSREILAEIKEHLQHEELIRLFPDVLFKNPKSESEFWSADRIQVKRDRVIAGRTIRVSGIFGSITGQHYDVIVFDDLHDPENISMDMIKKIQLRFRNCGRGAVLENDGRRIVIGTRWKIQDFYGRLMKAGWDTILRSATINQFTLENCRLDDENAIPLFPEKGNTIESLKALRNSNEMGSYFYSCNPGDAPIWMGDGTFKELKDVEIGDEVVGFELRSGKGKNRLIKTKVLAKQSRVAKTIKIKFKEGNEIRCTPEHKWWTGRGASGHHRVYADVGLNGNSLKKLRKIIEPCESKVDPEWRYLAGLFDGEGSICGSMNICQSQGKNPEVFAGIIETVKKLNIPYNIYKDDRRGASLINLNGGRQPKVNLINYGRPAKSEKIMDCILKNGGMITSSIDEIDCFEDYKREVVYSLQTESGNYVAWGYASKNCQMENNPIEVTLAIPLELIRYNPTPPEMETIYLLHDPAISKRKRGSDDQVIVTIGRPKDTKLPSHVFKSVGYQVRLNVLIDILFQEYRFWKNIQKIPNVVVGIESGGFQEALKQWIEEEQPKRGIFFLVEELKHGGRQKESRMQATQPLFENKGIDFDPDACAELIEQITNAGGSTKDDHFDAFAYYLDLLDTSSIGVVVPEDYDLHPEDPNTLEAQIALLEGGSQPETWLDY